MKRILLLGILVALSLIIGWTAGRQREQLPAKAAQSPSEYQCPMHPWIKSDHSGKCTICGMDLVQVSADLAGTGAHTDSVMLPEGAPQASSIRTEEIRRQKLTRTLRFAGIIEDDDSRHRVLSAYTGGRIEKLFVNYDGAEVVAGEPLALFYSRELLATAREYTLARRGNNDAIAATATSRLEQMGLMPEQIAQIPNRKENDLYFEILAPISGTVVKRAAYEGQTVAAGEKLMEIADFSKMWLQFFAYEQDLPFLEVGQNVEIILPALPAKTLKAAISFINPNLDETTRSALVRVEIPNPKTEGGKRQFLHKTYARVEVFAETPDALTVPKSAVLWPGDRPRVYVEKTRGQYAQRNLILGKVGDEVWEVLEGVTEGERVVVSGNMLLDGQAQIDRLTQPVGIATSLPEQDPARGYLKAAAAMSEALAMDDLTTYLSALATLPEAPVGFPKDAPRAGGDLNAARKDFQPFIGEVAAAAQKIRAQLPQLKVFSCPMSDQIGEGHPKNAQWVQFTPELHNPFFGKEMLECGEEVPVP